MISFNYVFALNNAEYFLLQLRLTHNKKNTITFLNILPMDFKKEVKFLLK